MQIIPCTNAVIAMAAFGFIPLRIWPELVIGPYPAPDMPLLKAANIPIETKALCE